MAVTNLFSSTGELITPILPTSKRGGVINLFSNIPQPQAQPTIQPVVQPQPQTITQKVTSLIKTAPIPAIGNIIRGLDTRKIGKSIVAGAKALPGQLQQAGGIIIQGLVAQKEMSDRFFAPAKALFGIPTYQANIALKEKVIKAGEQIREAGVASQQKVIEDYAKKKPESSGLQGLLEITAFNLPQVIASTGLSLAATIVTKNPFLGRAIGVSTSFGLNASEVYSEARSQGISDQQALPLSMAGGVIIGALDFASLNRLIKKTEIVNTIKQSIVKTISRGIVSMGKQSGFEGITEGIQEFIGNAIARTYNEHKNLLEGIPEAGFVGALLGGIGDISISSIVGITQSLTTKNIEKKVKIALDTLPDKRTSEQKAIVQAVLTQDYTPSQIVTVVMENNLGKTEIGKKIMLSVLEAERQKKNIRISPTKDEKSVEVKLVDENEPIQVGEDVQAEKAMKETVKSGERKIITLEKKPEGVKSATVTIKPDGTAGMIIEIEPAMQKKGIGTQVVKELEAKAVEAGAKKATISAFVESQGFWEKQGYSVVQGATEEKGMIKMEKDITPEKKGGTLETKTQASKDVLAEAPRGAKYVLVDEGKRERHVLSTKETKAIQEIIRIRMEEIRQNATSPELLQKDVSDLYKDVLAKAQNDKVVLSSLRTTINKEMYALAGADGGYKQAYATLKTMMDDPEIGPTLRAMESFIVDLDKKLTTAQEPIIIKQKATGERVAPQAEPRKKIGEEPKGESKTVKPSRLFERVKEALGKDYESKEITYNTLDLEKQAQQVVDIIESDPEKASRIVYGLEETPSGVTRNAVAVGLAEFARTQGDFATSAKLWTKTSLRSTRMGQEIVSLRGNMDETNPFHYVRQVINDRLEKVARQWKGLIASLDIAESATLQEKAMAVIKKKTADLKTELMGRKRDFQTAQSIIDALRC
ncbi:MAG: GNAT family N-acetyltransferase [Patescibacteria group bacterium]